MRKNISFSNIKSSLHPKRLLCLTMAGVLCFGSIQAMSANASSSEDITEDVSAYADSYDVDDFDYYVDAYTDYSDGLDAYQYSLTCDQSVLSFGKITQGSDRIYLPFQLYNTGSTPIDLVWYMTGNENGAFQIEQSSSSHLESGESCEFHVSADATLPAGTYNAAFRVSDNLDPGGNYGVILPMSVTIEEKTPYVTSVTVFPETVSMAKGSFTNFSVNVTGENNPNLNVTWSVSNNQSSGTYIDKEGKLVVDAKEAADNLTVAASSVQDPDINDYAYVQLTAGNHTVSVQPDSSAGGTVWGGGAVTDRSSCTVNAAPNNGYQFTGWQYNGQIVSTNPSYTIPSVTDDMSLTATFKQTNCYVSIKKNHDKAGSATASQNVGYGGSVTLEATANSGYRFDCWKEGDNVISKDAKYTVSNITGNREFTAYFTQTQYKVNVSVTPQDTGYTAGGATYNAGEKVTLTATSYSGYHFEKWTSGDKVLGTDKTLVIDSLQTDMSIVANFAKDKAKTYTITTVCANAGGTISPAGSSTVSEGGNVICSMVPDKGYMVSNVVVDNKSLGAVYSYTFTDVKANHAIAVSFQKIPADTTASASTSSTKSTKKETPTSSASTAKKETSATKKEASSAGTSKKNNSAESTTSAKQPEKKTAAGENTEQKKDGETAESSNAATTDKTATSEASTETAVPGSNSSVNNEESYDPHQDDVELTDPDTLEGYNEQTGVFQILNITPSDAQAAIQNGEDTELLQLAYEQDYITINIHNEYSADDTETAGSHFGSTASFPNLEYVINGVLTEEDKMCAFAGNEVSLNLTMYPLNDDSAEANKQIKETCSKNNLVIGETFEIQMAKTTHGDTQAVTEFETPMKVVMQIPESIKKDGRTYSIVRSHAEEDSSFSTSILQDLDEDPDTITFETDRLSSYAIAYQGESKTATIGTWKIIIGIVLAVIAIAAVITVGAKLHQDLEKTIDQ